MPTLIITFPGKRYHATPWGTHVNEGQVEWPPSPWRICRALLATGMSKLGWSAHDLPPLATELLNTLASVPPTYQLPPPLTVAHSRHYMPTDSKPTQVLDGFARVGDATLKISWRVELSPAAFMLFAELAEHLSYLGRAESWVTATLTPSPLAAESTNCQPSEGPELGVDAEPITLLAPMTTTDFSTWLQGQVESEQSETWATEGRKGRKGHNPAPPPLLPIDLIDCMLRSTADLRAQGWSCPPGSRKLLYTRPQGSLLSAQPSTRRKKATREPVECALIALTSSAIHGEVLPGLRLALSQMEMIHRALISLLQNRQGCPELTGRNADRTPLQDGHRHAHYLPLCLGDRRSDALRNSDAPIDHVLIYAPCGLEDDAQRAIERLRWVRSSLVSEYQREQRPDRRDRHRLTTTLVAAGELGTIREAIREQSPIDLFGESATWESYTPFIAPRFVKTKHPIDKQIEAELASRGLPCPTAIEILPREAASNSGFLSFTRRRHRNRPQPPSQQPWSLRLTFDTPIRRQLLALGYGSHLGLGLLRPALAR